MHDSNYVVHIVDDEEPVRNRSPSCWRWWGLRVECMTQRHVFSRRHRT